MTHANERNWHCYGYACPTDGSLDFTQPGAFAYQEVVRKKCDRAKLPGHFCAQCQPFIDATKDGLRPEDVAALQAECSRHRAYQPPQGTPDDFWELSFIDSHA